MTLRNLGIELRDGALHIRDIRDPLDLWEAARRFFKERRPVKVGRLDFSYPETTNGEVRQLADVWTRVENRIWRSDVARAKQHRDLWKEARSTIDISTAGADPTATFVHNEEFWLYWTKRQAIYLSSVRDAPSRWDMAVDSVKDSIKRLPENLANGAEAVTDAGTSVAAKAGEAATAPIRGAFRGLFGAMGTPLLVGAAVVGGFLVVPRLLKTSERRAP